MATRKSVYFLERLGTSCCFSLLNGKNTIGRALGCNIFVNSSYCSRNHCTIVVNGNEITVIDQSTNGTYLNDVQLLNGEETITVDTKIGIGVTGVEAGLADDENLYVLVLKSIVLEANRISINSVDCGTNTNSSIVKQEEVIIELLDSDDEPSCFDPVVDIEMQSKQKNSVEKSTTELNNIGDNIIPAATETVVTAKKLQLRRKSVQIAIGIFGSDIITDMRKDDDFKSVIDDNMKLEPMSDSELPAEPQKNNSIETNDNNNFDLINDEDFIQSQIYLQEVKEELNNFDNDDRELNNVSSYDDNNDLNDNNTYSPIIEISDDENDMDEEATSWMMKLSQSVATKKDLDKVKKINDDALKLSASSSSKSMDPVLNLRNNNNSAFDKTDEVGDFEQPVSSLNNNNKSTLDKTDEVGDIEMDAIIKEKDKKRKLDADIKRINEKNSKKSATIFLNDADRPGPIKRRRSTIRWEESDTKNARLNATSSKPCSSKESDKTKGHRTLDNSQVLKQSISKVKSDFKNREKTKADKRNRPEKLRFATIPTVQSEEKITEKPLQSILNKSSTGTSSKKKKVTFDNNVIKQTYNSYEILKNLRKIGTAKDAALPEQKVVKINEQRIMLNNRNESKRAILNEILSWKFKWLESRQHQIKGTNYLRPMLHHYDSFETYKNILYPLMKLEFWVTLEQDNRKRCKNLVFKHFEIEEIKDVAQKRIIFICEEQLVGNNIIKLFFEADLVAIEICKDLKVFGYVRCVRFNDRNCRRYYDVIIESNWSQKLHDQVNILFKNNKSLKIIKLSEIRIELGAFEAINSIKNSPLLNAILNPNNIKHSTIDTSGIKYTGYDRLNSIQEKILLKTYMRCINVNEPTIQLIEGPPGTGKSLVIVNLILQLIYGNESRNQRRKFLICAHSNVAVDVIATKLIYIRNKMEKRKRFTVIRFGNLERMNSRVRQFSLQECYHRYKKSQNGNAVINEENFLRSKIDELKKKNANGLNNHDIEKYSNELYRLYDLDRKGQINLLKNTQIICSTVSSCVNLRNFVSNFDICIIDEATQCNEPWSLLPIELGIKSLILTGDTNQLPATCISTLTKDYNYGKSLFTRIKETLENTSEIPTLLQQYRMHPEIAKFPNNYFYKNLQQNDSSTLNMKLIIKPYSIFNLNFVQNQNNDSSISNCMEAKFVIKLIEHLSQMMSPDHYSYGVITPYSLHRDNIYKKLKESNIKNHTQIEINTIDAFQGKEKDIIIISNARTEGVGFLKDPARLNVSLTRAKKCLILCGNYQRLEGVPVWNALLQDAKERSVFYNCESDVMENFEKLVISNLLINTLLTNK